MESLCVIHGAEYFLCIISFNPPQTLWRLQLWSPFIAKETEDRAADIPSLGRQQVTAPQRSRDCVRSHLYNPIYRRTLGLTHYMEIHIQVKVSDLP